MRPELAMRSETITVIGPGADLRVTPALVCGLDACDTRSSPRTAHIGGLPGERLLDGHRRIEPQTDAALPLRLRRIDRRLGIGHVEVAGSAVTTITGPKGSVAGRARTRHTFICAGKIPDIPGHGDSQISSLRMGGAPACTG